jgi:hypothetical protein
MDNGTAHHDDASLRQKAREAIRSGRLPSRTPARTYGGPGNGMACAVCGAIITRDDLGLEIEFDRGGTPPALDCYHVHPRCLAAWEIEGRRCDAGRSAPAPGAALSPRNDGAVPPPSPAEALP